MSDRVSLTILFIMLAFLSSCKGVGFAKINDSSSTTAVGRGGEEDGGEEVIDGTVSFGGITSVSNKTDSTITINWSAHPSAVSYDIYNLQSGTPSYVTNVNGQATTSAALSGLTPGGTYKFRVRLKTVVGAYDGNSVVISVTMNLGPDAPSGLTLQAPASSPDMSATPTVRVSGVRSGETVKLFTDSSCTTQVASGTASGTSIDLTTSSLAVGTYSFYATTSNTVPASSSCSTATLAYERSACPSNYTLVPGNSSLGTSSDFCVAKYEMRNVGGVATSQPANTPWALINQSNAKTACTALGSHYDLISNPEWMTIAQNIEGTAANWSGGSVGSGGLFRGHSDNSPANSLASGADNDPYVGTGNATTDAMGAGKEQKRTLALSTGSVLWDFSGNIWEWVDWSLGGALDSGPTTCTAALTELPNVSCGALASADYFPLNPGGVTPANYDSTLGLGQLFGGTGGATIRGGPWDDGPVAGIYAMDLNVGSAHTSPGIGFRCVYRP